MICEKCGDAGRVEVGRVDDPMGCLCFTCYRKWCLVWLKHESKAEKDNEKAAIEWIETYNEWLQDEGIGNCPECYGTLIFSGVNVCEGDHPTAFYHCNKCNFKTWRPYAPVRGMV